VAGLIQQDLPRLDTPVSDLVLGAGAWMIHSPWLVSHIRDILEAARDILGPRVRVWWHQRAPEQILENGARKKKSRHKLIKEGDRDLADRRARELCGETFSEDVIWSVLMAGQNNKTSRVTGSDDRKENLCTFLELPLQKMGQGDSYSFRKNAENYWDHAHFKNVSVYRIWNQHFESA